MITLGFYLVRACDDVAPRKLETFTKFAGRFLEFTNALRNPEDSLSR